MPPSDEIAIVAGLPPIRARKIQFYADATFKDHVPPTDAQGRPTMPGHPLNSPGNLAARPYLYGPPAPAPAWRISHAKVSASTVQDNAESDALEPAITAAAELDADAIELSNTDKATDPHDASAETRKGVFGFDDRDHHANADPDLGWNLPG